MAYCSVPIEPRQKPRVSL